LAPLSCINGRGNLADSTSLRIMYIMLNKLNGHLIDICYNIQMSDYAFPSRGGRRLVPVAGQRAHTGRSLAERLLPLVTHSPRSSPDRDCRPVPGRWTIMASRWRCLSFPPPCGLAFRHRPRITRKTAWISTAFCSPSRGHVLLRARAIDDRSRYSGRDSDGGPRHQATPGMIVVAAVDNEFTSAAGNDAIRLCLAAPTQLLEDHSEGLRRN